MIYMSVATEIGVLDIKQTVKMAGPITARLQNHSYTPRPEWACKVSF